MTTLTDRQLATVQRLHARAWATFPVEQRGAIVNAVRVRGVQPCGVARLQGAVFVRLFVWAGPDEDGDADVRAVEVVVQRGGEVIGEDELAHAEHQATLAFFDQYRGLVEHVAAHTPVGPRDEAPAVQPHDDDRDAGDVA